MFKTGFIKRVSSAGLILWIVLLPSCSRSDGAKAEQEYKNKIEYLQLLTAEASEKEPLPLILAMHGFRDTPENFIKIFESLPFKARVIAPRGIQKLRRGGYSWFPITITQHHVELSNEGILQAAGLIADLIESLKQKYQLSGKPVVCGFSQGGIVTFALALYFPEEVGLAVPISGYLPQELLPKHDQKKLYPPIRAFHGDQDQLIPIEKVRSLVHNMQREQFDVQLIEYPTLRHQIGEDLRKDLFKVLQRYARDLKP